MGREVPPLSQLRFPPLRNRLSVESAIYTDCFFFYFDDDDDDDDDAIASNWRNIELSRTHQTSGKRCSFSWQGALTNSMSFFFTTNPMVDEPHVVVEKTARSPEFFRVAMTDPMGAI